jgi:hypothetical protein
LAKARLEQLRKFTTLIIRSERFSPGAISGAVEDGLWRRILERMEAIGREHQAQ